MNIITIAGRLGKDPEVRFTSNGQKVTTLIVASNTRKNSGEETIWWRVTVWGENFDKMISYLKKGSAVIIVGDMSKPEIFTDREGKPQVSMNITASNIQFSPFGKSSQENAFASSEKKQSPQTSSNDALESEHESFTPGAQTNLEDQKTESQEFSDDEIPF